MATQPETSSFRHLRAFSYLLMLYGAVMVVVGIAVLCTAFAQGGADEVSLSLASTILGIVNFAVGGVTVAVGILGRAASAHPSRLGALHTVSVAGVVCSVLGAGLCSAVGNELPTSLLLAVALMAIALAVAANLRKQQL